MKIKVGGRYVARDGKVVEIIKHNRSGYWPVMCDQARSYTAKGRHIGNSMESDHDLMHEFKDEGSSSKLSTILTGLFWGMRKHTKRHGPTQRPTPSGRVMQGGWLTQDCAIT